MRAQGGIGDDISVGRSKVKASGMCYTKGSRREGDAYSPPLSPPPQMMHQKEVRGVIIAFYDGVESSWMWNRDIDISCSSKALLGEWNEHLSCYQQYNVNESYHV